MDSDVEEESLRGVRDAATRRGGVYYLTSETHNLFQVQLEFISGQCYLKVSFHLCANNVQMRFVEIRPLPNRSTVPIAHSYNIYINSI